MINCDGIIFDLDGTLWDATKEIEISWNSVITQYKNLKSITQEDLKKVMGMLLDDISETLFPNIQKQQQHKVIEECCEAETKYLEKYGAKLYPNLEYVLKKLNKKYKLFIVSNCQSGYIETFLKVNDFSKYFTDYECPGTSGLEKAENNKLIIKRNNLKNAVYVGDTQNDCNCAKLANIPFIFANYGFGDVKDYDYKIDSLNELLDIF